VIARVAAVIHPAICALDWCQRRPAAEIKGGARGANACKAGFAASTQPPLHQPLQLARAENNEADFSTKLMRVFF
jgi:hypothetical protein